MCRKCLGSIQELSGKQEQKATSEPHIFLRVSGLLADEVAKSTAKRGLCIVFGRFPWVVGVLGPFRVRFRKCPGTMGKYLGRVSRKRKRDREKEKKTKRQSKRGRAKEKRKRQEKIERETEIGQHVLVKKRKNRKKLQAKRKKQCAGSCVLETSAPRRCRLYW